MEELRKEPVTAGLILLNILVFLIVEFTGSSQNTMHMLDCGAAFTPMKMKRYTGYLPVCFCILELNIF